MSWASAHPAGAADRGLDIGVVEPDAALGQRVDMRGLDRRVSGIAEIVESQLVAHDEQDILCLGHDAPFVLLGMGPENALHCKPWRGFCCLSVRADGTRQLGRGLGHFRAEPRYHIVTDPR